MAASATVRAIGPNSVRPNQCSAWPPATGTSPAPGLNPNAPQHAAGILIDPPPSEPSASAAMPETTAAAPPPVDPPALRRRFHGLCVTPNATDSVNGQIASSGICVLPITT